MAGDFDWTHVIKIFENYGGGIQLVGHDVFTCDDLKVAIVEPSITEVVFFGKTDCNVYWSDGEFTHVHCGKKDVFSEETAILMAIAKRFMKGYTTVEKALKIAKRLPSKGRLKKMLED